MNHILVLHLLLQGFEFVAHSIRFAQLFSIIDQPHSILATYNSCKDVFFTSHSDCSKCGSLRWLSHSSVLIGTHFHSQALQDLFNPHVAVPVSHGGQFVGFDGTRFGIDTVHVDFGNEAYFWWNGGIFFRAVNVQLIKTAVVLGLCRMEEIG